MDDRTVTVSREIAAPPDRVWEVLADGWAYPSWVVGASRMRAVEEGYPAKGSKLHHSVGSWPALLDDDTEVVRSEPGRLLVLHARTRPFARAAVELELTPTATGTHVEMREDVVGGPALVVPKPVRQLAVRKRNEESLLRLAFLAVQATRPPATD
jgi:uncharacterized protein YndB with AHSA1/START domain